MNPIFKVILLLLLLLILLLFDIFTKNKLLVEKNAGRKGFFVVFFFAKYTFLKPCGLVLVLFVNFKYWGTEFD